MHRLIYYSQALIGSDLGQVDAIVKRSIAANAASDITGMLWFDGANFAQVLEGSDNSIHSLMDRVKADTRHTDITTVIDRPISRRVFGNWGMIHADGSEDCIEYTAFMVGLAGAEQTPCMKRLHAIIIASDIFWT